MTKQNPLKLIGAGLKTKSRKSKYKRLEEMLGGKWKHERWGFGHTWVCDDGRRVHRRTAWGGAEYWLYSKDKPGERIFL